LDVFVTHTRGIASPTIRRELRRRSAIEPVIGHLKADGLLERNHLAGAINAVLAAAGHTQPPPHRRMAEEASLYPHRHARCDHDDAADKASRSRLNAERTQTGFFTGDYRLCTPQVPIPGR
jgi:hypothetical protein